MLMLMLLQMYTTYYLYDAKDKMKQVYMIVKTNIIYIPFSLYLRARLSKLLPKVKKIKPNLQTYLHQKSFFDYYE